MHLDLAVHQGCRGTSSAYLSIIRWHYNAECKKETHMNYVIAIYYRDEDGPQLKCLIAVGTPQPEKYIRRLGFSQEPSGRKDWVKVEGNSPRDYVLIARIQQLLTIDEYEELEKRECQEDDEAPPPNPDAFPRFPKESDQAPAAAPVMRVTLGDIINHHSLRQKKLGS